MILKKLFFNEIEKEKKFIFELVWVLPFVREELNSKLLNSSFSSK